jgi:hypothetical protein
MRDVVPPLDPVKPAIKQIASEAPAGFAETGKFDYAAAAELFTRNGPKPHSGEAGAVPPAADWTRARSARRNALTYRRFATGAEAIRFAVEELAPRRLAGTVLESDGDRFESAAIRTLYESAAYPLPRGTPAEET